MNKTIYHYNADVIANNELRNVSGIISADSPIETPGDYEYLKKAIGDKAVFASDLGNNYKVTIKSLTCLSNVSSYSCGAKQIDVNTKLDFDKFNLQNPASTL